MTEFAEPTVLRPTADDPSWPLVVLLHGRGSDETSIVGLADVLPADLSYAALRAPIAEGDGFAWFANRGLGRPLPESLAAVMAWFRDWLDEVTEPDRPVYLVGYSGGAAFAGGLVLADPGRYAGVALLNGTLPFEAGVPTTAGRLVGVPVFVAHGDQDVVIPADLLARTWAYLHDGSGADLHARRDPGGHDLSAASVTELAAWLDSRTRR